MHLPIGLAPFRSGATLCGLVLLMLSAGEAAAQDTSLDEYSRSVVKIYSLGEMELDKTSGYASPRFGHGSGVVIDRYNCLILTNKHVIDGAIALGVKLEGEEGVFAASLVYKSPDYDLAFLMIDKTHCPNALDVNREVGKLPRGQSIYIIGYPQDPRIKSASIAQGIVSRYIDIGDDEYLQTSAAVNPGNSGGPALLKNGTFVGIVAAKFRDSEGMGIVIPGSLVKKALAGLSGTNDIQRTKELMSSQEWKAHQLTTEVGVEIIETQTQEASFVFLPNEKAVEKLSDVLKYQTDLGPNVAIMFAGIVWNYGVYQFKQFQENKQEATSKEAYKHLTMAMKFVDLVAQRHPQIRLNPFVKELTQLWARIQKEVPHEAQPAEPSIPKPDRDLPPEPAPPPRPEPTPPAPAPASDEENAESPRRAQPKPEEESSVEVRFLLGEHLDVYLLWSAAFYSQTEESTGATWKNITPIGGDVGFVFKLLSLNDFFMAFGVAYAVRYHMSDFLFHIIDVPIRFHYKMFGVEVGPAYSFYNYTGDDDLSVFNTLYDGMQSGPGCFARLAFNTGRFRSVGFQLNLGYRLLPFYGSRSDALELSLGLGF